MVRTRRTPKKGDWKPAFLAALRDCGVVRLACELVKMPRQTVYDHRYRDEAFAKAWNEALEEALDLLEAEARRRGCDGIDKPVYHDGIKIDTIKQYSDTLLIFLLKGGRPQKYRDYVKHEVTGRDEGPIRIRAEELSDDQLAALAAG
jgi:hypothetical protein